MKRILIIILALVLPTRTMTLEAEDLLPSEVYYNENIAVNIIDAAAPKLATGGDDNIIIGGGEIGGGGFVNSPIDDALVPIVTVTLIYAVYAIYRRKKA